MLLAWSWSNGTINTLIDFVWVEKEMSSLTKSKLSGNGSSFL